jgi:hypothetical protein
MSNKPDWKDAPVWVDVNDALPNLGDEVLIRIPVCGHHNIESAKYKGDGQFYGAWCSTRGHGCTYKVSHWMTRPQDPRP